ncbi:hypothetical protein A2899_04905 [Candidatus Amesbacteria bacterium RIFCSPLOWO2_01_FULL_49_25]|uniref:General secretion pathway GspH domain-containing protein n=1 Tax=Candidatus Amesbacteria bacterium RIFCSPHIGHO2_01_FULL_48_32b TaxID=1797253 RepID=A0A1F4YEP5_9BACT|nr:MAG: hypothetical protein A2876_04390 [Candidatus Amesbacteria bacterium RIFCSPHIGHO2_01_FULL_48_32b]OGD07919.1 MAG: hypothetical protein A2899_04905 [Candidatus Amesbacteria bacterium RIFCSPLOWO2_01_FULL_49_25]
MKFSRGFTLPELLLVLGIIVILLSVSVGSILRPQRQSTLSTTAELLLTDLKSQQQKAISGLTVDGSGPSAFGIHLDSNQYQIFSGAVYSPSDTGNFTVDLDLGFEFTSDFSQNSIVFSPASGETGALNTLTLTDTQSGFNVTYTFNRYGVAISQN